MKRLAAALAATLALVSLVSLAQADPSEYQLKSVSATTSDSQAGGHPEFNLDFGLKVAGGKIPATTHRVEVDLPPGLLANPTAVPACSAAQFFATDPEDPSNATGCPPDTQVGFANAYLSKNENPELVPAPVYNLVPRYGEPARLGLFAIAYPIVIDTRLRSGSDYGATGTIEGIDSQAALLSSETTLWGVPADPSHDAERVTPYEASRFLAPQTPTGRRPSGLSPVPFMVNSTQCSPRQVRVALSPYQLPDLVTEMSAPLAAPTGCSALDFKPNMSIAPTTSQAETGSGLDVNLTFPTDGLEHPNLLAEADQKRVEVTLPEGVTVNPSEAAGGLGVCSEAGFEAETASSLPNEGCPETSKIGNVTATSPLVSEAAEGGLFLAKPHQNPFGSLLAIYMVLKIPDRGVVVKLAGKVEPDPKTGQLITTFDDIPQLPVASFHLHFREGARAPLVTPPHCGTFTSTATFTAWSGQTATTHPTFEISRGVNGGPCPVGTPSFGPGFEAGAVNNNAAAYSPYYLRLTRADGEQDLTRFSTTLPPGSLAKLAGVSQCPQGAIEAAKSKSGLAELANPSCPASSEIGHVLAGAGVGQVLTYASGRIYLSGPYHGDPLSVTAIVPAVAGPFDVGTVVTQEALSLDPETSEAQVDGEHSDPIPHILAGIPLKVRDVRVYVDRPNFTLNPTNCEPLSFAAKLWGGGNDVFGSADDSPVSKSARFQAANCSLLGFKPKLQINLKGGTKRGGHPALRAVVTPRPGDANFAAAAVTLPHSAFLDQAHIRTICTRVQFAASGGNGAGCPAGAVYGRATAWSPLLDEPLSGPVFLRSSDHNLPDLVIALHGIVDINLASRIDSVKGGIRSTFEAIPDAPVSKFVLEMQGGAKGLIVNSTDLCASTNRAKAKLTGQNGRLDRIEPAVRASGCGKKHKAHKKHRSHSR